MRWPRGIKPDEINLLLQRDAILVNTSISEGFPSTFLEAWSHGCPVVSLNVDPDGVMKRERCGACAKGNFTTAVGALKDLISDSKKRGSMGQGGREYVATNHDPKSLSDRYEQFFQSLMN